MNAMLRRLSAGLRTLIGGPDRTKALDVTVAVSDDASSPDWLARGLACRHKGERDAALESFRRAIEIRHDNVEALVNQGEVENEIGCYDDAAYNFELALTFAPDCVAALLGLGRLEREVGDHQRGLHLLQRAVQLAPHSAEAVFELGYSHQRVGDSHDALTCYSRALELQPHHVAARINLGLVYLAQRGDALRAQQLFEAAAARHPESIEAQSNLGLSLQEQGQFGAALAHYARLINAYPEVVEYRWNRGTALLIQGDFAHGWDDYELRNSRGGKVGARQFPFPEWTGGSLTGHHLLVYGEQGIGDEIMFASCIPDVLCRAQATVIECEHRLMALYQRSFPAAHIHGARRDGAREWLGAFPMIDTQIAVGSLPRLLRRQWSDFPQHGGYLVADPRMVADWKSRLAALGNGLKVGLSWRGGTVNTRKELRSLAVSQCLPLLASSRCQFICLQNGDCSAEIESLRHAGVELQWWPEATSSFDDLAALVTALDLVISVDNTVAHLSGALGRPLMVLLSASPDWRYLWQGDRMPWYPNARLFRQHRSGDWQSVIESVKADLDRFNRR